MHAGFLYGENTHNGTEFSFQLQWKKSRVNNSAPFAHHQENETRTEELKTARENPSWVYTKSRLFCRWLPDDYKAPGVKGLNHSTTAIQTDLPSWHLFFRAQWSIYALSTLEQDAPAPLNLVWPSGRVELDRLLISKHGATVRRRTGATL